MSDTQTFARAVETAIFQSMFNALRDPDKETFWRNHADKLEHKFTTDLGNSRPLRKPPCRHRRRQGRAMTVPQAWLTLLGLGVLAAFLCWISETWRDIFGFFVMVAIALGVVYGSAWCVYMAVMAVSTLTGAP